jgi:hypothetical protein
LEFSKAAAGGLLERRESASSVLLLSSMLLEPELLELFWTLSAIECSSGNPDASSARWSWS